MEILIVAVIALLVIAAATALGPRLGITSPLLLVVVGIGASLMPFVPDVHIEPEWILAGVLPPLLYSAAVSMPAMNFRREFRAIGGLSVVLVVVSAVVLGLFFSWVIPGLGLGWGIALGAIVSPTDAVATSIVKDVGVSTRVATVLEGESLINDATALVVLRAAIAGAAASISLWGVLGSFVYAIAVALIIGYAVGRLNLIVRARVEDATVNTVLSFTVPFLASIPAEELGASGLVAAVVAGLITGHGAPRILSPRHRMSDSQNWRTIEFVLEGGVFLLMGLELSAIVGDVQTDHAGVGAAVGIASGAILLIILVRAAYLAPLLAGLKSRGDRGARMRPQFETIQHRLDDPDTAETAFEGTDFERLRGRSRLSTEWTERFRTRLRRGLADIDYFLAQPLGWREGAVVVWAGMRGVVTLAAAQTLPADTPSRSLLILIAFLVATCSLLLQGGTLSRLIKLIKPSGIDEAAVHGERVRLMALLDQTADRVRAEHDGEAHTELEEGLQANDWKRRDLAAIAAQRKVLLEARDDGAFSAGALGVALAGLDADQISLELKGTPTNVM